MPTSYPKPVGWPAPWHQPTQPLSTRPHQLVIWAHQCSQGQQTPNNRAENHGRWKMWVVRSPWSIKSIHHYKHQLGKNSWQKLPLECFNGTPKYVNTEVSISGLFSFYFFSILKCYFFLSFHYNILISLSSYFLRSLFVPWWEKERKWIEWERRWEGTGKSRERRNHIRMYYVREEKNLFSMKGRKNF